MLLVAAACQVSGNPVSTPTASPTQPVTDQPLFSLSTPTASGGYDLHTLFPSFSLTDPNTVCVDHYYYALSCLDSTGWNIYENEYDEISHPTSTIPHEIFGCPDGRIYLVGDTIYQVEGETLIDIGGYVDQGIIACGRGNEIWVSDFSEVSRFDGSTWTHYPVEEYFENGDGLPSMIYSLGVAPNGNAWVTTDNTIATFDGAEWEVLTLPGNYYFMESFGSSQGLAIDSNGVVWMIAYPETCCVDSQLLKFDGVEWSTVPSLDDDYHEMQIIAVDNMNRIWASTGGRKIFALNTDTNEWELRFDVRQLGLGMHDVNVIHDMQFDGQGRLWVTTNYGLGIYDGSTWTTYHFHTANLYMNEITGLTILGDVPQLPALELKLGSVRGKLVSETQTPFTDVLVEICIDTSDLDFSGDTLCADQAYHALENVNADGSFLISNVPAGTYFLNFKISNEWYRIEREEDAYLSHPPYFSSPTFACTVKEGEETQLGEITAP